MPGRKERGLGQVFSGHPNPVLTKSYQWSQDGDGKWSKEHVDVAVEERHLPCARVSQTHHVGVTMVHIDVVELSKLCRKGSAHLERKPRGHWVPRTQLNEAEPKDPQESGSVHSPQTPSLLSCIHSQSTLSTISQASVTPGLATHCHLVGVALESI